MKQFWLSSFFLMGICANVQISGSDCPSPCQPEPKMEAPMCPPSEPTLCPEVQRPAPCCEPSLCGNSSYLQVEPLPMSCSSSYNLPAAVAICADVPFYLRAAFLYWYVGEEGLSLASNAVLSTNLYFPSQSTALFPSFEYKPGFKVGLGYTFSREWTLYSEYTWLRGKISKGTPAPSGPIATAMTDSPYLGAPVWAVNDWFIQTTPNGQAIAASNLSSQWHYAIDFVDLVLSRPFYEGRRVIVNPYGGLRGAWIDQKMEVSLTEAPNQGISPAPTAPISSLTTSRSWAVGPRVGADVFCLLSRRFRVEADMAASLLYTRYTKLFHEEDPGSLSYASQTPYQIRWNDYSCLRAMAECALGLGWGEYWQNEAYHIDFSLDYSFSYLWGQNMIRKMLDETLYRSASTASDMYFHGLTFTGRLDF